MHENISVDFAPTEAALLTVEAWLKAESDLTGEGFFVNWSIIKNAFDRSEMAIVHHDNSAVGFAIWRTQGALARLDIVEVHPALRKQGVGRILLNHLEKHFLSNRLFVIELQCEPAESEVTWKKLGFIEFGPSFNSWGNKRLYKILPATLSTNALSNSDETISLWHLEPIYVRKTPASWTWNLSFIEGTKTFTNPIIIACDKDWQLAWQKGGKQVFCKKAKYFHEDCMSGDFLVIEGTV